MVACMSYIDVELFTNIANNYLQKKFDLGRPSVFLFSCPSKYVRKTPFLSPGVLSFN